MKKRELLYALGATIAAFVGWVIMSYLVNRSTNWLLAIFFAIVSGLSFSVLSFMKDEIMHPEIILTEIID